MDTAARDRGVRGRDRTEVGGCEHSPRQVIEFIEKVSRADVSTGWLLSLRDHRNHRARTWVRG